VEPSAKAKNGNEREEMHFLRWDLIVVLTLSLSRIPSPSCPEANDIQNAPWCYTPAVCARVAIGGGVLRMGLFTL